MIERSPSKAEIKVLRPKEVVQQELKDIARQYWKTKPGSFKSIVDDLRSSLHEISGGRFGEPSLSSRMASTFEEATDVIIAEANIEMTRLRDKYESKNST